MSKVIADITMSLDGYVTGAGADPAHGLGDAEELHDWVMEPDDVTVHLKRLQLLEGAERDAVAEHLVALAFRLRDQAGEGGQGAIALLLAFTAAVLENAEKAASLFSKGGLEKEAATAIGMAQTMTAPRAPEGPKPGTPVKPKRGLR